MNPNQNPLPHRLRQPAPVRHTVQSIGSAPNPSATPDQLVQDSMLPGISALAAQPGKDFSIAVLQQLQQLSIEVQSMRAIFAKRGLFTEKEWSQAMHDVVAANERAVATAMERFTRDQKQQTTQSGPGV